MIQRRKSGVLVTADLGIYRSRDYLLHRPAVAVPLLAVPAALDAAAGDACWRRAGSHRVSFASAVVRDPES